VDLISFMIVVWVIKVLAEDGWAQFKGQNNPRMDRRKARQKSRAGNPIWTQFVGWLGDVAEDAREEQGRRREDKRRRQDRERHEMIEEAEIVDMDPPGSTSPEPGGPGPAESSYPDGYNPDPADPSVVDMDTPPPRNQERTHDELTADECTYDICPIHGKGAKPKPDTDPTANPYANTGSQGAAMAIEIKGLDPAIDYAKDVASSHAEHGTAGNEGYLGALTAANVTGPSYDSAAEAQEASSIAAAKWEKHAELMTEHKRVQEAQDQTPDAGTQEFNQGGR
jgi:hypothetical protein